MAISEFADDRKFLVATYPKNICLLFLFSVSYAQYVCFPPEHIREYDATGKLPTRFVRGSKQGDIYCVGMIFYMMIEREDPYRLIHSVERPGSGKLVEKLQWVKMSRLANK